MVKNILCEYLTNPIGLGIKNPRITWNDFDVKNQTAFEIIYKVNGEEKTTGIVKSNSMNYIFQESFNSRDIVEYKIRIQNEKEVWSNFSETQTFEMGLLDRKNFVGKWITGNYKPKKNVRYPVDYFKKSFDLKNTTKARLYISACGVYEASLNGCRIGDFILAPGTTDPRKRIQYQTYDVTSLLRDGKNEIVVALGDGWYRGSIGAKGFTYVFGKETKIFVQLEIETSSEKIVVISDDTWSWSNDGPIRFSDLKDGEVVDNRLITSFNKKAKETKFNCNLKESNNNFVIENDINIPIKNFKSKTGKTILEFENNIAGYISFEIEAKDGDKIDIQMGELLDKNQDVTLKNIQCIRKKKKTPLQEVHLICKDGLNSYKSKFYYGGFKYISINTNLDVNPEKFKQIGIHTKLDLTSKFECSNPLINSFYNNTIRSMKSNSIDIPTDCPTRERMGWTGDSQVFFNTACYLSNYAAFTRKHINDVFDRQDKNGRLPQIAPFSAEDWFMDPMNGSVGWADVGILTPYRFYKNYGDKRLLFDKFESIERYAKFMIKRCGFAKGIYALYAKPLHLSWKNKKYQVNTGQSYGEWAEPNDVKAFVWTDFCEPHPEESMAYTCWMMKLMGEICDIVGRTENKNLYKKYEEGIRVAYQELVTKKRFSLDTYRQAKLVRPLYLNLLTKDQTNFAKERLIKALEFYKWRLGTGFLSTPFILNVLNDINPEYAYKLLENEEMPGWLFMSKNNTGTIWEGWEGPLSQQGISSLNHYSKGVLVEWLFNSMLGINIESENKFILKPSIGGKETFAKGSYKSIYGTISISWKKENNKISFDIEIPCNTTAIFIFKETKKELEAGKYHFDI